MEDGAGVAGRRSDAPRKVDRLLRSFMFPLSFTPFLVDFVRVVMFRFV